MSHRGEETPSVISLDYVIEQWAFANTQDPTQYGELRERLIAREDNMRDVMFMAGQQFGLFPQIVAEVLAEVGLGTPKSTAEREMIRTSFNQLMEALVRAQRGEGPMPTP